MFSTAAPTNATSSTGSADIGQTLTFPAETFNPAASAANYISVLGCTASGGATANALSGTNGQASNTLLVGAADSGKAILCTYTNTINVPKVQITKTTLNGSGSNTFSFALSGLSTASDRITVVGSSSGNGSSSLTGTAGTAVTISETSPAGWPANPVSARCLDSASATPLVPFGTLTGHVLSISAANMGNGANITCTFTNDFSFSVTGLVFTDNGSAAGTANDGVVNGGEAGRPGVSVSLSDCAATTYATATSDGSGNYSLSVPFSTAAGAQLCVEETNGGVRISTGASVGSTALPSGTATAATGGTYTYTRTGTPDRIAFAFNGTGHAGLNFGDVDANTFAANGAKTGLPGTTVVYAHTFTAQTGGVVNFSVLSSVGTPALAGWNEKVFADVGCTGTLQAGAAILYPPAAPTTTVAGQQVCIIMQEFIPATAPNDYLNTVVVQAAFTFTNASPALSASYQVTDVTTVGSNALDLKKEVRNVTQSGVFGISNQAKSGETLEYRITYTNNAATSISTLAINDTTPAYSSFASAQAGSTPSTLTACVKTTPANPLPAPIVICPTAQATGGTGPIDWKFTGSLAPGGTGTVLFQVKVN